MNKECNYSFSDLFSAANGRHPTAEEIAGFERLDQAQRNTEVKKWATTANWQTEDRVYSDGLTYTAFWPREDS